jgi:hypothetical protein
MDQHGVRCGLAGNIRSYRTMQDFQAVKATMDVANGIDALTFGKAAWR